ncbi:putative membrane protein [Bradyrhizobium sp. USDA 4369]
MTASVSGRTDPVVRRITTADIAEALTQGLRDFQAQPLFGLAFGLIYVLGGISIVLCVTAFGMVYLAYPLAAGFALLGPFVAIGLYEVSRRRELGQPITYGAIWRTITSRGEIAWMAFVTVFFFVIWMYQIRLLIALLLGLNASFSSFKEFMTVVLTTNEGLLFLVIGNLDGAALSLVLFSLTVVSFPLLLDRDVDFVTAMITSVRAVVTSPGPMIGWAAVITVLLIVSALPYFLGLLVTAPVLGHATWHLYRRIVAPA